MSEKWDGRFLVLAATVAGFSKDPSTKTGAIIVDGDRRIVSTGYNGFARGVVDHPDRYNDRDLKYLLTVHCEVNAIVFAKRDLTGCTLYTWPFGSCARCAAIVIQSGISRVVFHEPSKELAERWGKELWLAKTMFMEAGVAITEVPI